MENRWFSKGSLLSLVAVGNLNRPLPLSLEPPDLSQFPPLFSVPLSLAFSSSSPLITESVSTASSSKLVVTPHNGGTSSPPADTISKVDLIPEKVISQIQVTLGVQNPRSRISHVPTIHKQSTNMDAQDYEVENGGLLGVAPPTRLPDISMLENSSTSPLLEMPTSPVPIASLPQYSPQTWAEMLKHSTDRSLCRLAPAPTIVSPTGKPRIKIPDEVFRRGADMHKKYIGGYFLGKTPSYHLIQSVLNHMLRKGKKLEIHVNFGARTMLVRLPNDVIRQKILEKKFWHVDQCMFHVAQWGDYSGASPLELFPLWAHLKGVPFDLMTREGLSLIAGLVGEPKERDDYTINLVSSSIAHVKVEANLTKHLPDVVVVERENGYVAEVYVEYPWLPSTCSHCHQLGHIIRYCPKVTREWIQKTAKESVVSPTVPEKGK